MEDNNAIGSLIKPFIGIILLPCLVYHAQAEENILLEFPAISQLNPSSYGDPEFMELLDSIGSKTEPVKNLACAAAVYTMIDRGTGKPDAMIDGYYTDPRPLNGNGPGATRPPFVNEDTGINAQKIIDSLSSRIPVILHGYGGPLKEHFVLVVGMRESEGKLEFLINDPWPENKEDQNGKKIELNAKGPPYWHPTFKDITFIKMRTLNPEYLDWAKIKLADVGEWSGHPQISLPEKTSTVGTNNSGEYDIWKTTPEQTVKTVIDDPEALIGKSFRFHGDANKLDLWNPKKIYFVFGRKPTWGDGFPPSIQVLINDWYDVASKTSEGRTMIRRLSTAHRTQLYLIAKVSMFSNTFKAYLKLERIMMAEDFEAKYIVQAEKADQRSQLSGQNTIIDKKNNPQAKSLTQPEPPLGGESSGRNYQPNDNVVPVAEVAPPKLGEINSIEQALEIIKGLVAQFKWTEQVPIGPSVNVQGINDQARRNVNAADKSGKEGMVYALYVELSNRNYLSIRSVGLKILGRSTGGDNISVTSLGARNGEVLDIELLGYDKVYQFHMADRTPVSVNSFETVDDKLYKINFSYRLENVSEVGKAMLGRFNPTNTFPASVNVRWDNDQWIIDSIDIP